MEEEAWERIFDVVIFGASGFTGKYVIREALKFLNSRSSPLRTVALAGRNREKVAQALRWAASPSDPPPLPIIEADTSDPTSLSSLCRKTKILLNCVGPFRLYGEPVVAACVDAGTDYLDITGEPEFMEKVEILYHDKASRNGSLVVSACGYDSVPAELGLVFNSRQWEGRSAPNKVEAYLNLESDKKMVGNFGTFHAAVLSLSNAGKFQELRRSRPLIPGPPPSKGALIERQKSLGLWAPRLPTVDTIVVGRTLSYLAQNPHGLPGVKESEDHFEKRKAFWSSIKPAHFGVRVGYRSLLDVVKYIMIGLSFGVFGSTAFGRSLLLRYPELFTLGLFRKTGPTEEEVESATFKMWFVGHGYSDADSALSGNQKPDTEIITRISGPEIGYITTPIILVQCALILLHQRENLPKGGVYTPGIVFGATDLQERLQDNGVCFDFISRRHLHS